ncbi:hypothetical protein LTH96_05900 [Nesterenkonia sp. LB17]|uniref:hypothetical protein n=1 Tax=Nesterenkonia sp. LB17 TaxID=2901230 RepID=UPI001F4CEEFF|nr:hypothetical protein [Nesterenkonia sp. LB17]MCH8565262.1 hypothetical protein [Nesterenkonia sp. LB17]
MIMRFSGAPRAFMNIAPGAMKSAELSPVSSGSASGVSEPRVIIIGQMDVVEVHFLTPGVLEFSGLA